MSLVQRGLMTIDQETEPVWGAPQPTKQRWGMRETVMAVGVAGVIAGLGGAAIYAATGSNSQPAFAHGGPGGSSPSGFSAAHLTDPLPSLHGELVTSDGKGGFVTMLTQTGTVTAITPATITVRSSDAFTQTYNLPPAAQKTGQPLEVNSQVSIQATRVGQVATAGSVSTWIGPGGPAGPPGPAP